MFKKFLGIILIFISILFIFSSIGTLFTSKEKIKVLHFAPEQEFYKRFKKQANLEYTTTDLLSPLADIKADIEDMLLELTDYQIEYSVTELKYYKDGIKGEDCLRVYIKDNQNRSFGLDDIMDVLLRIKDYLKESDYSIDLGIPNSDDYLDIDNFMKEFSGEELYNLNIFIFGG